MSALSESAQNADGSKQYSDAPVTDILVDLAVRYDLSIGYKSDYFGNSRASIDTRGVRFKSTDGVGGLQVRGGNVDQNLNVYD